MVTTRQSIYLAILPEEITKQILNILKRKRLLLKVKELYSIGELKKQIKLKIKVFDKTYIMEIPPIQSTLLDSNKYIWLEIYVNTLKYINLYTTLICQIG